jgi:hypothetical protein
MRRLLLLAATLAVAAAPHDPAAAADRRIKLINNSSYNITEFHASNINRHDFEENILAGRTLAPGSSVIVNLDDGTDMCRFDFLTLFSNGAKVEKRDVDVCQLETYTLTD